jgi:D-alanyl-D-alanine carboxypeptidase/D-alanyl-D-alanine carboxypeptidase (penicillin-binding protein 5/6)
LSFSPEKPIKWLVAVFEKKKGTLTAMRYYLISLLLLANLFNPFGKAGTAFAQGEDQLTGSMINGESAILIDGTTGQVLFEKNAHQKLYPASITKIATGIYAIEKGNPDDIVTVSKRARWEEGTRVYLAEGEQVTLRKLEYGLLMNSGNDAATAIAEHMSGSVEQFAEDLNAYLKEKTGVEDTHFTNAHGLHDPNHYTTAADMAKIAQYAMKNQTFREIVATVKLPWQGKEWNTVLINHNKLLRNYEGATGIKNGFTDQAHNTLVSSAKRGETEFIAVTMKAPSSNLAYKDVTKMLDYAFAHYETRQVAKAGDRFFLPASSGQGRDEFYTSEDLYATVPLGAEITKEVTPNGRLVVMAGSERREFALSKKETPPAPAGTKAAAAKEIKQGSETARYFLLVAWLLLNVLLVIYAVARAKRKRKLDTYQFRRRADWS